MRASQEGCTPAQRQRPVRSRTSSQELLPGIPNEITLDNIAPKLSWVDFYTLSLVSPAWWQANRSRQVYDARVRAHSTETLAVLNYTPSPNTSALALFSTHGSEGRFFWKLPPIPGFESGIPKWCKCVSVDGRVYILGGKVDCRGEKGWGSQVFVMDLAGQRGWKRCKSMGQAGGVFGCCTKDGKIYVLGGNYRVSEVYDPNEDSWSSISPMQSLRYCHKAELMGDEIVLHGGNGTEFFQEIVMHGGNGAEFFQFYNPVKDEWTEVWPFRERYSDQVIFTYQDRFHILDKKFVICERDGHQCLSADVLSFRHREGNEEIRKIFCCSAAMGDPVPLYISPKAALPVNDDLLIILELYTTGFQSKICLVLGKGFRTSKEDILMEIAPFFEFQGSCNTKQFMVPIVL